MTLWSRRRFGGALWGVAILPMLGSRAASATRTHEVAIRGFRFDPPSLAVQAGDRVRWVNHDVAPHTATGTGWDTGGLAQGVVTELAFPEAGRFPYVCVYHPMMTGEIVVAGPPRASRQWQRALPVSVNGVADSAPGSATATNSQS